MRGTEYRGVTLLLRFLARVLVGWSRQRQVVSAIGFLLFAFTKTPLWPKQHLLFAILGVSAYVGSGVLDFVSGRASTEDESKLGTFSDIHAGCLQHLTEAAECIGSNPHRARSKLEDAQGGLLTLLTDAIAHVADGNPGEVTANLMIHEAGAGDGSLRLVKFSTVRRNRTRKTRIVTVEEGVPGAAEAFLTRRTSYVSDTHKLDAFEHDRPYRTILSLPLMVSRDHCVGVANVDSDKVDAFSEDTRIRLEDLSADWLVTLGFSVVLYRQLP